jgi:SAM-dependent methyltransferase
LLDGFERDDTLIVPTSLAADEMRARLAELRPYGGWRHLIRFSNGVKTSDVEMAKPWSDRPLHKIKRAERALPDFARRGGRALDVGCNCGYNSLWLANTYGMNVVGIEASVSHKIVCEFLAGQAGIGGVDFKVDDAETYLEPDGFDLVLHFGTLYHLRNPVRALETASRNLRTGGVLALETQCHGGKGERIARYVRNFDGDPSNWWALGDGALRDILAFCGFGEPVEVFHWTSPALDGMYRIIWVLRKVAPIEATYEEIAGPGRYRNSDAAA